MSIVWVMSIFVLSNWYGWNYITQAADLLKFDQHYTVLWKWETTLNFISEIKSWNRDIFDIFDLEYHAFSEIMEEEVVLFEQDLVKFKFYANTSGDSLHQYYYTLHFDDNARLIAAVEG